MTMVTQFQIAYTPCNNPTVPMWRIIDDKSN